MFFKKNKFVPADVPNKAVKEYQHNYALITKKTNNLFLFACDQKIEHLNKDFYGPSIDPAALNPEHLFKIAAAGHIGAMALHAGLLARYGNLYRKIPYIAKLNGKTSLLSTEIKAPYSAQLWTVKDIIDLKEDSGLSICGVGYTIYIGSEYESEMLAQAAQIISQAHMQGLLVLLWIYARGKHIKNDTDPEIIAGACGLANALGADFVKVKPPQDSQGKSSAQWLDIATTAAGNTHVICSGGSKIEPESFFAHLEQQLRIGRVNGCAVGRNIFQRSFIESVALTKAIHAMVYEHSDATHALQIYKKATGCK